jgi:predicted DNA-binding protein (MmcQ/YjbR family)
MNLKRFDAVCGKLPGSRMVIQWGGSHVYKVGEKMFAVGNLDAGAPYYVFKTTPLSFEILLAEGFAVRAPYLTRGTWVKVTAENAPPDADLAAYLKQSHAIVAASLPKAARSGLGM